MRGAVRIGVTLVTIAVVVASFVNVFGDDATQRKDADALACPTKCPGGTQIGVQRTPFGETVTYTKPNGTVTVSCARAAILIGPWSCTKD